MQSYHLYLRPTCIVSKVLLIKFLPPILKNLLPSSCAFLHPIPGVYYIFIRYCVGNFPASIYFASIPFPQGTQGYPGAAAEGKSVSDSH